MAGRRVLADAQAAPNRDGYWHHPGTLGRGTWGTGVQETWLMPRNPSSPQTDPGQILAHHKGPKLLCEAFAQPTAPWEVPVSEGGI